ncbi:hypothetical protein KI387_016181, partial [Taxus chinensis]
NVNSICHLMFTELLVSTILASKEFFLIEQHLETLIFRPVIWIFFHGFVVGFVDLSIMSNWLLPASTCNNTIAPDPDRDIPVIDLS